MNMEKALRARLAADPGVGPMVTADGTVRIYWVDRPQNKPTPDITLQTISGAREQHLKGFHGTQRVRVQADVRAPTYDAARALRELVIAAVVPRGVQGDVRFHRGEVAGLRDLTERPAAGGIVHRHSIDFFITYSNA
jgi:hypothetical protein